MGGGSAGRNYAHHAHAHAIVTFEFKVQKLVERSKPTVNPHPMKRIPASFSRAGFRLRSIEVVSQNSEPT